MSNGFWMRQSKKDKITIIVLAIQLFISVVLVLSSVVIFDSQTTIAHRLAVLSVNVVALFIILQFAITRLFDDQKDQFDGLGEKIEAVNKNISHALEETRSIAEIGETYIKIYKQEENVRIQYQNTLDGFLRRLRVCIDDKRSGPLDIMEYYGVLKNQVSLIEANKDEQDKNKSKFNGEIWALTFLLDDEWDDSSTHEANWFAHLKKLDKKGVSTRRLWAFDKKMLATIKKDPIGEDGIDLLRRLAMYCSIDTDFKNTSSFAVAKEEILDTHVRLFGKGFFATALSNGELNLIRGVCFDNLLSSNSLGGEIDFDKQRIKSIKNEWERYLELAIPLKEYLRKHASDSAILVLDELKY
jgi:hypothetical protein